MAPPAHTDAAKWEGMMRVAREHLSDEAIDAAGLLSREGVRDLFARHEAAATSVAEKVQMDAVINHLLGVQILHRQFVATDVPAQARAEADRLGWRVAAAGSPRN
jgi:asparagine synthase (glutamine-hydrolysing)